MGPKQRKIVSAALRKEARRAKARLVANIDREQLIQSGVMRQAYSKAKIRAASNNRKLIRIGIVNPERSELGISADDLYYYPYAVEFGHEGAAAMPFIRPAIEDDKRGSFRKIGSDIKAGILREAMKP
jgi:hypothetical protein